MSTLLSPVRVGSKFNGKELSKRRIILKIAFADCSGKSEMHTLLGEQLNAAIRCGDQQEDQGLRFDEKESPNVVKRFVEGGAL